jgi:hypothetical protein
MNSVMAPSFSAAASAVSTSIAVLLLVLGLPESPRIRVLKYCTHLLFFGFKATL